MPPSTTSNAAASTGTGKQKSLTGWFTVKKKGRDDAEIEKDRQIALAAKRKKNKKPKQVAAATKANKPPTKKQPPTKTKTKPKRKLSFSEEEDYDDDDDDDDDHSMDDFVVDDDASLEDDDDDSSIEEVVNMKRAKRKGAPPMAKRSNYDDDDDDDDDEDSFVEDEEEEEEEDDEEELELADDSSDDDKLEIVLAKKQQPLILSVDDSSDDDEEGTFLQKTKHRPSKPSQVLQRAAVAAKTRRNPALKVTMQQKNPIQTKTKPVPPKRRPWQEDDSSSCVTSPSPLKKSKSSHNHNDPIPIDMDSSEDERPTNSRYFSSKPSKAGAQARNGCHFEDSDADDKTPIKSGNRPTSSSLEDTPAAAAAAAVTKRRVRPKFTKKITTKPLQDSSEDEQLQQAIRKSLQNNASKKTPRTKQLKKKNSLAQFAHPSSSLGLLEDSSDEEDNPQPKRTKNDDDDSSMDQDERLALKAALKASEKSAKQEKVKRRPTNGDVEDDAEEDEEPTLEQILGEESSDEEQENPEEAYDEERNAANSVLNTAEQLSAQVIQTMKEWMNNDDDDQDDHNNSGKTPQGMIVDGAISLGSLGGDHSHHTTSTSSHNHQWISQDVMKQACSGVTLSNYQLIGVNWLALLHGMECTIDNQKTNVNGVLADEMGLGKTVQTIAFLAWLKQQRANSNGHGRPHLIIVPVSVLPNWMREFETFCPEMKVVKYHGSLAEREELQEELRSYLPKKKLQQLSSNKWKQQQELYTEPSSTLDVILAPVSYFQKEKSDDRRFLLKFQYEYLVVDEAHMLKNSQSTRYKMLDRIPTRYRLLLTGTPVQNSPQELLNMLCFLMPLFSRGGGGSSFDDSSDSVGDRMLQHFVDDNTVHGDEEMAYKKLKHLFAPFVLRRKKADVIAQLLPPKKQVVEYVDLDPEARNIYDSILESHVHKNCKKVTAAIGDHLFTNLRKAAHHPLLLRTRHTSPTQIEHLTSHFHKYGAFKGEGSTKARVAEELAKFNDFHIHLTALELIEENQHRRPDLERYILDEDALFFSAKFSRLRSLLPKLISDGHRILIFSVWTSCLDLLGCLMEYLRLEYLRMDGSCPSDVRQQRIDQFNRDNSIPVFLLSTKACGLGINLTAADTCIIHDLDFNPFNDLQAEDRCHRIGQKKSVTVYKLVTKETVDADIYDMQERKSKMNAAILESNAEKKERREMLQSAMNRFLASSPPPGKKLSTANANNKENVQEVQEDMFHL